MTLNWLKFALIGALVTACGTAFQPAQDFDGVWRNGAYTGGSNQVGQRYTGFSSVDSLDNLKKHIEERKENIPAAMLMAMDIEWADMKSHRESLPAPAEHEIRIKWRNTSEPQIFRGARELYTDSNKVTHVVARLKPVSDNGRNLNIDLTCSPVDGFECGKGMAAIVKGDSRIGGIEFVRKNKLLKSIVNPYVDRDSLSQEARQFYDSHKEGERVVARSFSVVYGPSQVEVSKATEQGLSPLLNTDLLDPSGEMLPVRAKSSEFKNMGRTSLIGNNSNGSLIFLQEDGVKDDEEDEVPSANSDNAKIDEDKKEEQKKIEQSKPKEEKSKSTGFAFTIVDPEPTPKTTEGTDTCPVARPGETSSTAKQILTEVVRSCEHPGIKAAKDFWANKSPASVKRVLNLYKEAQSNKPDVSDVAKRMRITIRELKKNNFPLATLAMPMTESGFNPHAIGAAGEKSEMQIMACTALGWGLVSLKPGYFCNRRHVVAPAGNNTLARDDVGGIARDERNVASKSHPAALAYLKSHFDRWNSIAMAIASYNAGLGTTQRAAQNAEARLKKKKDGRVFSYGQLDSNKLELASSDFFVNAEFNTLGRGPVQHTMKVLAGNAVLLGPQTIGISEDPIPGI